MAAIRLRCASAPRPGSTTSPARLSGCPSPSWRQPRQRSPKRPPRRMPPTEAGRSELLQRLKAGGKPAVAAALADLERSPESPESLALLDAAYVAPLAHVVGLTGPPGVGKSTLA